MNKEYWKKVEDALNGVHGHATLLVDGQEINFIRAIVKKNRLGIVTYLAGELNKEWCRPDIDFVEQKFLRPRSAYIYSSADRRQLEKMSARRRKMINAKDPDTKVKYYSLIWESVASIRRHYEKNFSDIKLVEVSG